MVECENYKSWECEEYKSKSQKEVIGICVG